MSELNLKSYCMLNAIDNSRGHDKNNHENEPFHYKGPAHGKHVKKFDHLHY